jgi:hypothetical protein
MARHDPPPIERLLAETGSRRAALAKPGKGMGYKKGAGQGHDVDAGLGHITYDAA